MAERPVANALTLELEPVVAANMIRHLDSEDPWYAHDYVPFEQGENFAFLGGRDWDPSQVTLPKLVTGGAPLERIVPQHALLHDGLPPESRLSRASGAQTRGVKPSSRSARETSVTQLN